MVKTFQTMLDLNKKLHAANTPSEKTMLQRQIDSTDHQIDKLVYPSRDVNEYFPMCAVAFLSALTIYCR